MFHPQCGALAVVRPLGAAASGYPVTAMVMALEGKHLILSCPAEVAAGTPLRVDIDGALLLGEITLCDRAAGTLVMDINQAIPSVPEVAKLMQSVFGEECGSPLAGTESRRRRAPVAAGG